MSATYRLFSKWAEVKKFRSAMAACAELGVTRASATNWKNGRNAEAHILERMAAELGDDPMKWVLAAAAEKSQIAEESRTLMRLAKTLGYAGAFCLAVYTSAWPASAQAESRFTYSGHTMHCASFVLVTFRLWFHFGLPSGTV